MVCSTPCSSWSRFTWIPVCLGAIGSLACTGSARSVRLSTNPVVQGLTPPSDSTLHLLSSRTSGACRRWLLERESSRPIRALGLLGGSFLLQPLALLIVWFRPVSLVTHAAHPTPKQRRA